MNKADECVRCAMDMYSDGRTKKCKEASKRYTQIIAEATDDELQDIADKTGWEIEELKDRRKRFKETLANSGSH
jgi:hypothetical protein